MRRTPRRRSLSGVLAVALLLAACASGPVTPEVGAPDDSAGAPDAPVAGEVSLVHPFTRDQDLADLRALLAAFEAAHPGVVVREEAAADLATVVEERVAAGAPPDAIVSSSPLLLRDLAADGVVLPLDDVLDRSRLATELVAGLLDLGTSDGTSEGTLVAIPLRVSPRSLVWYAPSTFADADHAIPTTWDELLDLGAAMAADGLAPWCIGIESGAATGWVVADWVEDVVLRGLGGAEYDRWVAGDLPFAGPAVQRALEERMLPIWSDESVFGGRALLGEQPFNLAALGILGEDPDCGMHRQALVAEQFILAAVPDARFGVDYDFFALPPIVPGEQPMIGAVDHVAVTTDDPATTALVRYLATAEAGASWSPVGGFFSPFVTVPDAGPDGSSIPDSSAARASEILATVTAFRIDGSDQMPPDVGASAQPGSFWSEMAAWARDERSLAEALANIDERFARSR